MKALDFLWRYFVVGVIWWYFDGWLAVVLMVAWLGFCEIADNQRSIHAELVRTREAQEERDEPIRSAEDYGWEEPLTPSYEDYSYDPRTGRCEVPRFPKAPRVEHSAPIATPLPPPAGWFSMCCGACGKRYDGVSESEANRTLNWHIRTNHA